MLDSSHLLGGDFLIQLFIYFFNIFFYYSVFWYVYSFLYLENEVCPGCKGSRTFFQRQLGWLNSGHRVYVNVYVYTNTCTVRIHHIIYTCSFWSCRCNFFTLHFFCFFRIRIVSFILHQTYINTGGECGYFNKMCHLGPFSKHTVNLTAYHSHKHFIHI